MGSGGATSPIVLVRVQRRVPVLWRIETEACSSNALGHPRSPWVTLGHPGSPSLLPCVSFRLRLRGQNVAASSSKALQNIAKQGQGRGRRSGKSKGGSKGKRRSKCKSKCQRARANAPQTQGQEQGQTQQAKAKGKATARTKANANAKAKTKAREKQWSVMGRDRA